MGSAVGGKMSMGFGDDADFLDQIVEVLQLVNDITRGQVLISVTLIIVSVALILLGISLLVLIM